MNHIYVKERKTEGVVLRRKKRKRERVIKIYRSISCPCIIFAIVNHLKERERERERERESGSFDYWNAVKKTVVFLYC